MRSCIKMKVVRLFERTWIGDSILLKIWVLYTAVYIVLLAKYATFDIGNTVTDASVARYNVDVGKMLVHYNIATNSPMLSSDLPLCSETPKSLKGAMDLSYMRKAPPSLADLERAMPSSLNGGKFRPTSCRARQKIAVIIPYRDRMMHLRFLLKTLHDVMQRQEAEYGVFVSEQADNGTFNKGLIMNIAFDEAMKQNKWDCFIFHDVDMIPENDLNLYRCRENPQHLSPALDEMRYSLMYYRLVGGVLALSTRQVLSVNGYSNKYWGWGAEDDDMSYRIFSAGFHLERPPNHIGRYKMVKHVKREAAPDRVLLLQDWERWPNDGVNSLSSINYKVLSIQSQRLYTHIKTNIGKRPQSSYKPIQVSIFRKFFDSIYLSIMDI